MVSNADFLAGYGAAQAVPGPLFTFSAYLGAVAHGPLHGWIGGLALLGIIFLPAFFMLVGALPFWEGYATARVSRRPWQASMLAWSAFWCRPCTTLCGPAPSTARRILAGAACVRATDGGSRASSARGAAGRAGGLGHGDRYLKPVGAVRRPGMVTTAHHIESHAGAGWSFHGRPVLTMAFMMISSLRMQATMATFFGLPAASRRS